MLSYWYELYTRQTVAEKTLEPHVAALGFRYRTQHPFLSAKAISDFYFPDYNVTIEVDDDGHSKKKGKIKDQERTKRLAGLGVKVYRFTNEEVISNPSQVASTIKRLLEYEGKVFAVSEKDSVRLGIGTKRKKTRRQKSRPPRKSYRPVTSRRTVD